MSSGVDVGWEESLPPAPEVMSPELAEYFDALDDSLLEAAACGDVGFGDRFEGTWWAEYDPAFAADDDPTRDPDAHVVGSPVGSPADPLDVVGPVEWLRLTARVRNQSDARFLAAIHRVAHHHNAHDPGGHPIRDPFAADEVGAALGWSTGAATYQLGLADAVVQRLPRLYQAMAEGWLDLGKATTVVEATRAMPDDLAAMATTQVLPVAAGASKAELALRLDVAAGQLDPEWATRREQAARRNVRLEGIRNPTGTADLALRDLGAEDATRARARIEALAVPVRRAARAAGIPVGIVVVRALVAQRLWDGTHTGLDDDTLITRLVDELPTWYAALHHHDEHSDPGPDDSGPDDSGPDDPGPDDPGPDDPGPDDPGPDDPGPDDPGPDDFPGGGDIDGNSPGDDSSTDSGDSGTDPTPGPGDTGGTRRGTVELRMRLSTALGLDDLPAELVTHGALTARSARRMLDHAHQDDLPTECRVVLTDPHGHLEHVLLIPLPGLRPRRAGSRPHGIAIVELAIVELAIVTTDLAALQPTAHPRWQSWLRRAQQRLAALPGHGAQLGGPAHPATTLDDADRRLPGRELDRHIRVRDRHCIGPLCTRPAHHAEIDHTHDWAHHGRTLAANLGAPCHHCHRLKHLGNWRLDQPESGHFRWHSPLGATHTVHRRPVLEPPLDPAPRSHRRPRPVLDRSNLRAERDGWIDKHPRYTCPAPAATPPRRPPRPTDITGDPHADHDPPPF